MIRHFLFNDDYSFHTEIKCPALSTTAIANSDGTKDEKSVSCLDGYDRSVGTVCTVQCSTSYKAAATGATTTCTLNSDSETASWVGTLECEGI